MFNGVLLMGRSVIGQEPGAIKKCTTSKYRNYCKFWNYYCGFYSNAVNRDKTEVYFTGWSQNDVARNLTSDTTLQVAFRHGSATHYYQNKVYNVVEYY